MFSTPRSLNPDPDRSSDDSVAMDFGRFERLITMAGPDVAPDLICRLTEDLSSVETDLARALAQLDWVAIRHCTHVLIGLAGAVGAMRLSAYAKAMNLTAHAMDRPQLVALAPETESLLKDLIGFVESQNRAIQKRATDHP